MLTIFSFFKLYHCIFQTICKRKLVYYFINLLITIIEHLYIVPKENACDGQPIFACYHTFVYIEHMYTV